MFPFENVIVLNTRELQFESVLENCGAWSLVVVACCSVPASADVVCVRRGRSSGAPSVRAQTMAASSSKKEEQPANEERRRAFAFVLLIGVGVECHIWL